MATLFNALELGEIRDKALDCGLAGERAVLVAWLPVIVQASLPNTDGGNANALALDLNKLNKLVEPVEGEVPLVVWLREASAACRAQPSAQTFFADRATTAAQRAATPPVGAVARPNAIDVPERILFRSSLLPDDFIALAAHRAASVARLRVPRLAPGAPQPSASGEPPCVYGTGWLIGPQHLMTNWHVVAAQSGADPGIASDDLAAQIAQMTVEFDYIADTSTTVKMAGAQFVHGDAALDYAIVRLADDTAREPLPVCAVAPTIDPDNPIAANVIQHAGAAPRQFAIRNNLAALIQGDDLAYFTDTAGGSSGSPVCNDRWDVVALHKASTPKFGDFSFQGKTTAWLNVGTVMAAIIKDFSAAKPTDWAAMRAIVRP